MTMPEAEERGSAREPEAPEFVKARDGTSLYVRHWPASGRPWATMLIVHGIAEHLGRHERTARLMAQAGLDVHSFDLRGHGRSGGRRVFVQHWDDFLSDVEERLAAIRVAGRPTVLFGLSMGALISLTYCLSERPRPDLLVLSAPPLDAKVPAWQRVVAPLLSVVAPTMVLANPIDGADLAHDPAVGRAYFADPLVQPRTTTRLGAEFFAAMKQARSRAGELQVPTLVIHGGEDRLVPTAVSEPLGRLPGVERRVLGGLRHETLNEPEGPDVVAGIVAWICEQLQKGETVA